MDYSSVRTLQNTSKPITFRTPLPRISVALVSAISIRFNSMRHGFMAWRKLVDKGLCVLTGCLFCPWLQVVSTYGFFSLFVTHWRLLMVCHISTWPLFSHWWSKCRIFFPPFCFSSASPACVWRSILAQNCSSTTTTVLGKAPLISFSAFISF